MRKFARDCAVILFEVNRGGGAFRNCINLSRITLPSGITAIEWSTFDNCKSLSEVNLPDGITTIGSSAFRGCKALIELSLPESVVSIDSGAFRSCTNLTRMFIPKNISEIHPSAFSGCFALTEFTVDKDNAFFTSVDGVMFSKNMDTLVRYPVGRKASNYVIPNGVNEISGVAFSGCANLTTVTIPSTVKTIGASAFSSCTNLVDIVLPDSITKIGEYAFSSCENLTEISLPEGLTEIENSTFNNCSNLVKVLLPNQLTRIGAFAFQDCRKLTGIYIPESVTFIEQHAFYFCTQLSKVIIPSNNTTISENAVFGICLSLTLYSPQNFKTHDYAVENNINWRDIQTFEPSVFILDAKREGNTLIATVETEFGYPVTGSVFAAAYDKDNGLVQTLPSQQLFPNKTEYRFDISGIPQGSSIRIFVWDSLRNMRPLAVPFSLSA